MDGGGVHDIRDTPDWRLGDACGDAEIHGAGAKFR
jgi:hypothetical protein